MVLRSAATAPLQRAVPDGDKNGVRQTAKNATKNWQQEKVTK